MKKLITIFLSIIPFALMAQVPQGVGYQGVATDANGIELVNQSISIRASVLSGSATGTIEWEETHITSTDDFGLFTLTIGEGTSTGNGAQSSFADISWGINTHFLKIEMDATGGTNYSFMGTNQMMSVPYALYAKSAGIDSTMILNIINSSGGGSGCNYSFPEGIEGQTIAWDFINNHYNYTVPSGKNLFITHVMLESGELKINGFKVLEGAYTSVNPSYMIRPGILRQPICVGAGDLINCSSGSFYGILTDAIIDPITYRFDATSTSLNEYNVPVGKKLIVTNIWKSNHNDMFTVDGVPFITAEFNKPLANTTTFLEIPLVFNEGSILSVPSQGFVFNGYLVDENYFANCGGGGGSSSSTTINYDSLANIISMDSTFITTVGGGMGGGGGCNFKFPQGINGDVVTTSITNDLLTTYITPPNKRFYLITNDNNDIKLPFPSGVYGQFNIKEGGNPFIIGANTPILSVQNSSTIHGILIDESNDIEPITEVITSITSYTVPAGKRLYINNFYEVSSSRIQIEFNPGDWGYLMPRAGSTVIIEENQLIKGENINGAHFNGYLVDENYFANCGGGGSSSSTSNVNIDSLSQVVSNIDSLIQIITPFFGCTDPTACNYDSTSIFDNGTCSGLLGCTDILAPNYNALATCNNSSCAYAIGDYYGGGVIFYLDGNGGGLIADIQDLGTAEWGCSGTNISTGTNIGTGTQNTINILAICSQSGIAAELCDNSSAQGYTDWFLPSEDELHQMYLNKSIITVVANSNGGSGGFNNYDYWSSTEHSSTSGRVQDFGQGHHSYNVKINAVVNVRAIRAF